MLKQFILSALIAHKKAIDSLVENKEVIANLEVVAVEMAAAIKAGNKIFACGNGGSMCDAMHFAEEMTGRFREDRKAYAAIAISDPAHIACVGNDYGFEAIFSKYIEAHGRPGDVLLGITTSGTSKNVIRAIEEAKKKGVKTVALTGRNDTKATQLADYSIVTPAGPWADRIQEQHILCIHILIEMIERQLNPENYSCE